MGTCLIQGFTYSIHIIEKNEEYNIKLLSEGCTKYQSGE
jgi:hypothetical protein